MTDVYCISCERVTPHQHHMDAERERYECSACSHAIYFEEAISRSLPLRFELDLGTFLPEIPELYEIAKRLTHEMGQTWTDPRTRIEYPPPEKKD